MQFNKGTKFKGNRALSLACLLCLLPAHAEDAAEPLQVTQAQPGANAQPKYADRVYWPMMPGESLEQLALSLYPNNAILRERFIKKTMSLSRVLETPVLPSQPFSAPGLLIIPNEKAVKELTHRIKKSDEVRQTKKDLRLSYQLKTQPILAPKVDDHVKSQTVTKTPPASSTAQPEAITPDTTAKPATSKPNSTLPPAKPALPDSKPAMSATDQPAAKSTSIFNWTKTWFWIDWPKIDWRGHWQAMQTQIQHAIDKSARGWQSSQHTLWSLKQDYASKSLQQVFQDYRLRNIALVSLLGGLFLLVVVLHRRRARRQQALLSLIRDTIHHDAEFTFVIPGKSADQQAQETTAETLTDATRLAESAQTVSTLHEQRGNH